MRLGLERHLVDPEAYARTVRRFRDAAIVMPAFAQLPATPARPPVSRTSTSRRQR